MKLVVGLGNPGRRYADTRHNAGFRVVSRLAQRRGLALDQERFRGRFGCGRLTRPDGESLEVALLEPHAWMNLSGGPVLEALAGLGIADPAEALLVVYDDVDLPFGRVRVRPGGGAGGHRGVADLIARLGRQDFARVRFGVGRPPGGGDTAAWVLEPFSEEEQAALPGHLDRAAAAVETLLLEGVRVAMDRFNPDPAAGSPSG